MAISAPSTGAAKFSLTRKTTKAYRRMLKGVIQARNRSMRSVGDIEQEETNMCPSAGDKLEKRENPPAAIDPDPLTIIQMVTAVLAAATSIGDLILDWRNRRDEIRALVKEIDFKRRESILRTHRALQRVEEALAYIERVFSVADYWDKPVQIRRSAPFLIPAGEYEEWSDRYRDLTNAAVDFQRAAEALGWLLDDEDRMLWEKRVDTFEARFAELRNVEDYRKAVNTQKELASEIRAYLRDDLAVRYQIRLPEE
jgi:hypothetical protein